MRNLKETKKRLGCNRRKRSVSKENETKRSISGKNTNEQMNRFVVTISNFRKCLTGAIFCRCQTKYCRQSRRYCRMLPLIPHAGCSSLCKMIIGISI